MIQRDAQKRKTQPHIKPGQKKPSIYDPDIKEKAKNLWQIIVSQNKRYFKGYKEKLESLYQRDHAVPSYATHERPFLTGKDLEGILKNFQFKKTMENGDSFGEISIITGRPRTGTILCNEQCEFLCLDANCFKKVFLIVQRKIFQEKKHFLVQFPFLQPLQDNVLMTLMYDLKHISYPKGTIIYQEGDQVQNIYFILKGQVRITKYQENKNAKQSQNLQKLNEFSAFMNNVVKKKNNRITAQQGKSQCLLVLLAENSFFGEKEMCSEEQIRTQNAVVSEQDTLLCSLDIGRLKYILSQKNLMPILEQQSELKNKLEQRRIQTLKRATILNNRMNKKNNSTKIKEEKQQFKEYLDENPENSHLKTETSQLPSPGKKIDNQSQIMTQKSTNISLNFPKESEVLKERALFTKESLMVSNTGQSGFTSSLQTSRIGSARSPKNGKMSDFAQMMANSSIGQSFCRGKSSQFSRIQSAALSRTANEENSKISSFKNSRKSMQNSSQQVDKSKKFTKSKLSYQLKQYIEKRNQGLTKQSFSFKDFLKSQINLSLNPQNEDDNQNNNNMFSQSTISNFHTLSTQTKSKEIISSFRELHKDLVTKTEINIEDQMEVPELPRTPKVTFQDQNKTQKKNKLLIVKKMNDSSSIISPMISSSHNSQKQGYFQDHYAKKTKSMNNLMFQQDLNLDQHDNSRKTDLKTSLFSHRRLNSKIKSEMFSPLNIQQKQIQKTALLSPQQSQIQQNYFPSSASQQQQQQKSQHQLNLIKQRKLGKQKHSSFNFDFHNQQKNKMFKEDDMSHHSISLQANKINSSTSTAFTHNIHNNTALIVSRSYQTIQDSANGNKNQKSDILKKEAKKQQLQNLMKTVSDREKKLKTHMEVKYQKNKQRKDSDKPIQQLQQEYFKDFFELHMKKYD